MNITAESYNIECDKDEMYDIADWIRASLYEKIKTHYIHHQSDWAISEKKRLMVLKSIFESLGRTDLYNEFLHLAHITFKEYNNKQNNED